MEGLFEQMAHISKAHAYDVIVKHRDELAAELKALKASFYMDICRAYNAGRQNEIDRQNNEGNFSSSHEYFTTEFPAFKTNVP